MEIGDDDLAGFFRLWTVQAVAGFNRLDHELGKGFPDSLCVIQEKRGQIYFWTDRFLDVKIFNAFERSSREPTDQKSADRGLKQRQALEP